MADSASAIDFRNRQELAGIEARAARIAELETFDTGLPITQARGQAARAAENFRFFADTAVTLHEDAFASGGAQFGYVIRKPEDKYARVLSQ